MKLSSIPYKNLFFRMSNISKTRANSPKLNAFTNATTPINPKRSNIQCLKKNRSICWPVELIKCIKIKDRTHITLRYIYCLILPKTGS